MIQKIFLSLICLIISRYGNSQTTILSNSKPLELNDGIKTAALSEMGMNPSVINELSAQISSNYYPNIHSLLIYKNDNLVFEKYFPGKDPNLG